MKIKDVYILKEAVDDLNEGRSFYDLQEQGVGDYFWDCIIADIESLIIYAGIHNKNLACFKFLPSDSPMPFTTKLSIILRMLLLYCPCAGIQHGFQNN